MAEQWRELESVCDAICEERNPKTFREKRQRDEETACNEFVPDEERHDESQNMRQAGEDERVKPCWMRYFVQAETENTVSAPGYWKTSPENSIELRVCCHPV